MAQLKEYQCKKCKYTTLANPKGHDLVMMGKMYHFVCKECQEIVNVVTKDYNSKKIENPVCPECGSANLEKWNPRSGKCPKCGGDMEETEVVMFAD